ncbi:hypothetical protein ACLESD_27440 [Pyxidicoccus sp. 3LFB2]
MSRCSPLVFLTLKMSSKVSKTSAVRLKWYASCLHASVLTGV